MKHKHAEVIKAWADGAVIEFKEYGSAMWQEVQGVPCWWEKLDYRVKPEKVYPKTRMVHGELYVAYTEGREEKAWSSDGARNLANAAIRHAIDSGQVVVPESAMSQQK